MDLLTLVSQMQDAGYLKAIATNPLAQFGTERRRYLGAEILPEMMVDENQYRDEQVKFRTIIANDGTRYSPTQKKDGDLVGYVDVILGNSDIAREMNGREYDALLKLLMNNREMDAMASLANWADTVLNRALVEKAEYERWQALISAQVVRSGDNGFTETVTYSNPSGHRFAASDSWSDDTYDPFEDIFNAAQILYDKGFTVNRIFANRTTLSLLSKNAIARTRTGKVAITPSTGTIAVEGGRANLASINLYLNSDGLPNIELYDLQYRTQTGTAKFLPNGYMVFVATTGRDENLDLGDGRLMPVTDTLGYYAVGRAAGQGSSGRVVQMTPKSDKPPRIEGEAWQTSFPVILEPEAVVVINSIA